MTDKNDVMDDTLKISAKYSTWDSISDDEPSPTDDKEVAPLSTISTGADNVWLLLAGVMVFFMQSGFALLESGTVRFKNY